MALNPQNIIDEIVRLSKNKRVCIAYSGGVDSHVLLHILANNPNPKLKNCIAIHIDHGLNPDSRQWTQHCAAIAEQLNVDFCNIKIDVQNIKELGMEAAARQARYHAFQNTLTQDEVLLTAQHQNDQAETLLLQLLRGAGPKGLSAMAMQSQMGQMQLLRPLLSVSQADIVAYAKQYQLQWIEDPSNLETQWNRNYIRHTIWPIIEQRWPSAAITISRSAAHCAEASELMADLAQQDLASLNIQYNDSKIAISPLLTLSPARLRNALRYIIEWKQLPLPSTICLQKIIDDVCLAKQDSVPIVSWTGVEVRRYHDALYFMLPLAEHDGAERLSCNNTNELALQNQQVMSWQSAPQGINQQLISSGLTIRYRQGGEKIKPQGHAHHKTLKHLFQQWNIPTWQRERIPLIFKDDELIVVVGHCISDSMLSSTQEITYIPMITQAA
ncbi:MAG: tRNA lysidine(34) synthetase TilS [Piscirickettsiaceae bacterium]|nr:tRNA lysidine(34) synthetase TilS [Piscirickettsiaceae bacterium]